jgi:pimeloyl-ACP methyl ester carboxylesterase
MLTRTATAILCLIAQPLSAQDKPPSRRELDKLVEEVVLLDLQTAEGRERQEEILQRTALVPPLRARDVKTWQKKIAKAWEEGRTLEGPGDHWFWPEEKRGRYIVGGETKKPNGLAITMHGGGVGSGDAGAAASAYGSALSALGLVMVAPEVLEKTELGWTDSGTEEFVLGLVDAALRTWKIDPARVYFVGHSMGGYGSWSLGAHHADRAAAIAPSAGAPTPIRERRGGPIVDLVEGVIPSLRNVYVSIYQSADDPRVPPDPNRFAAEALAKAAERWGGYPHEYWEVEGRGHGAPPGGYEAHVRKIVTHERDPIPTRIVWQPVLPWKHQFYWLSWDRPALNTILQADLDREANKVAITCSAPTDGLWVLLDERVLDLERAVTVTVNDVEVFSGIAEPSLATMLRTSQHPDPGLQFVARVPAFAVDRD